MSDDLWLPVPSEPKADEPISYEDWRKREDIREYVGSRLILIARGIIPGPDPVRQLAELEIVDITTGRGAIDDGRCPGD